MKTKIIIVLNVILFGSIQAQDINADSLFSKLEFNKETFIIDYADNACNCIDSISLYNKSSANVSEEIGVCISRQLPGYLISIDLLDALSSIEIMKIDSTEESKSIALEITEYDENSEKYQSAYFEIERYLLENCEQVREKVSEDNKEVKSSFSENDAAIILYDRGVREYEAKEFDKAIKSFKKAVKIDSDFAFAWDNLGLAYRHTKQYKKAIKAYEKSIKVDPKGFTPRQNLAIVYTYLKDYDKAIEAYENLAKIDDSNPEVYYGIGIIQCTYKEQFEKALRNMCIAYTLYVKQNSPYRSDAEKAINMIFSHMSKQNQEELFYEILEKYGLTPQGETEN